MAAITPATAENPATTASERHRLVEAAVAAPDGAEDSLSSALETRAGRNVGKVNIFYRATVPFDSKFNLN